VGFMRRRSQRHPRPASGLTRNLDPEKSGREQTRLGQREPVLALAGGDPEPVIDRLQARRDAQPLRLLRVALGELRQFGAQEREAVVPTARAARSVRSTRSAIMAPAAAGSAGLSATGQYQR
jgi:hypothetical protein